MVLLFHSTHRNRIVSSILRALHLLKGQLFFKEVVLFLRVGNECHSLQLSSVHLETQQMDRSGILRQYYWNQGDMSFSSSPPH